MVTREMEKTAVIYFTYIVVSALVLIVGSSSNTWGSVLIAKHCGPLFWSDLSSLASFTSIWLPSPMFLATSLTPPNWLMANDKESDSAWFLG